MNAPLAVIGSESNQLAMQIEAVPEESLVEILAPQGSNQPLDERMRARPEFGAPRPCRCPGRRRAKSVERCEAAEARIAALDLEDCGNQFFGGPLGSGAMPWPSWKTTIDTFCGRALGEIAVALRA